MPRRRKSDRSIPLEEELEVDFFCPFIGALSSWGGPEGKSEPATSRLCTNSGRETGSVYFAMV